MADIMTLFDEEPEPEKTQTWYATPSSHGNYTYKTAMNSNTTTWTWGNVTWK